jgi:hypothetical protein
MKFAASLVLFVACVCIVAPGIVWAQKKNPITISQCFITQPKPLSKTASGTQIDYVNNGSKTATNIIFAVGYRNAQEHFVRKVTDVGNFAPGQSVQHHFSLYNDVTYAGTKTASCSAIAVTWSDGTRWTAR